MSGHVPQARIHFQPARRNTGLRVKNLSDLLVGKSCNRNDAERTDFLVMPGAQSMPTQLHNVILVATDLQRSVLNIVNEHLPHPIAYTSYGHRPRENGLLTLLGYNGELSDPLTGHYLLGNGYRAFNPVLMRFNSPDSWSPFGKGGLNGYAYCSGDPVNRVDPTGHVNFFKGIQNLLGLRTPSRARAGQTNVAASQGSIVTLASSAVPTTPVLPNYTQRQGSLAGFERPPPYSPRRNVTSLPHSQSEPSLGPPPLYPSDQPSEISAHHRARAQHKINKASAHLQRIEENTQNVNLIPPAILDTINTLTDEINAHRSTLGKLPLYQENRNIRDAQ
jgi:RHS repeat-associated protein